MQICKKNRLTKLIGKSIIIATVWIRIKEDIMRKIIAAVILLSIPTLLVAHPGRTDKRGGHNGPNGYHYHNSGSSSSNSSNSGGTSSSSGSGISNDYITSEHEIKELQSLLKEFGFYSGPITGKYDTATIDAANAARVKYNLQGSEYFTLVTRPLLIKLRAVKASS